MILDGDVPEVGVDLRDRLNVTKYEPALPESREVFGAFPTAVPKTDEIRLQSAAVDQPQAALLTALRRRGLLDETLVLWGGEFGRTVYSQGELSTTSYGRDHHPRCFSVWAAGGGIRPGVSYGKTDEYSYNIVENPLAVHDLHATLLHCLGLEHDKLVYRHQGRDFRLTDVFGRVVPELLA